MDVELELRHLQALVAVADELSFTRAAERLHLSQQALSSRIREMERRLGLRVLERDTRSVALTPAGERLTEHARGVLAGVQRGIAAARSARPRLVLGVRAPQTRRLAAAAFDAFARRRPDVDLVPHFGGLLDPSAGLRDGEADVALVAGPFSGDDIERRALFTVERGVALAAGHPLAARPAIALADLLEQPIVDVPTDDRLWHDYWYLAAHRAGRPAVTGATAHSMEGQLEAVRAGVGVIVTLEPVVRELAPEAGIAYRPVAGLEPAAFAVAWRASDDRREVADFVAAAVAAYPDAPRAPDPPG